MRVSHLLTALALSATFASAASASVITVQNATFETPDHLSAQDYNNGAIPGWVESSDASNIGTMENDYTGGSDTTPTSPVVGLNDDQWLYIRASSSDTSNNVSQNVGTIDATQIYTLSLTLGHNFGTPVGDFIVGLYTDDGATFIPTISLAQKTNADVTFSHASGDPANTGIALATVTFDARAMPQYDGSNLYIYLSSSYTTETTRTLFDAVSLTAVPEPTSGALALLGLGGLAMLGRRRKQAA